MRKSVNCFVIISFMVSALIGVSCDEDLMSSSSTESIVNSNLANRPGPPSQNTGENDTPGDVVGEDCTKGNILYTKRGECTESLAYSPRFSMTSSNGIRTITANNIPDHKVGLFGNMMGSLNPNAIRSQSNTYRVTMEPALANNITYLLNNGPVYSFGVLLNGVEVDPVAAEPWPHDRTSMNNVNWTWNLEATNVRIGLDCNSAHVQPNGKYHYHASPVLYIHSLQLDREKMTLIGYAADGFPIYHKFGYKNPDDPNSGFTMLQSSYRLKTGERPGDGISAPCGEYNGIYSNDYEYVHGLGDLDECNGRAGVTPEYPNGIYYYVITDDFPSIPRCFKGTPSQDFGIGY